jgi:hypothetical protein
MLECNAAASGRAEVVAKKFNIKMTKVLPLALALCVCVVRFCSRLTFSVPRISGRCLCGVLHFPPCFVQLVLSQCTVTLGIRSSSARAFAPLPLPLPLLSQLPPKMLQGGPGGSSST